jgi:hypothetical protein
MTIKHLITHAVLKMKSKELIKGFDLSRTNSYGSIDLFLGPGDEYSFQGIQVMYDPVQKLQFVQWEGSQSTISKPLFDRDLAPKCYEIISQVKESLGKLDSGTIYLVKDTGVTKL